MSMRKHYSASFKAEVVLELLKEEKTIAQISSEYGVHVTMLHRWKNTAVENMSSLFEDEGKKNATLKKEHEKETSELYAKIGRLTTEVEWLKKNLASNRTRDDRVAMVDHDSEKLSISRQAELLSLNRSSLYYNPVSVSDEEIRLRRRIDEIYTDRPVSGSRYITAILRREGWAINRKRVVRCMREMGIAGVSPSPNLSKRNLAHKIYPYLLRGVKASHPNHVWSIDITYIRLKRGWMYLVAVIDLYSRYIVSWELDQTLEIDFVLKATQTALGHAKPEIWNSDQGSHFTSPQYTDILKQASVRISMDGKNRAVDNIFIERFWRTLKYQEVYTKEYATPREARESIRKFVYKYNHERPHQSLNYHTPAGIYLDGMKPEDPIPTSSRQNTYSGKEIA
ncbi:IS3 family transposase [Fodinisporobacter ferrooxydans]|uniref:IS3 family transposase n=1 Tax=Fodinisporobacter ferrooxydans TaxID=2901836 RepID=A0ABY4CNA1_9BACL|nr:IS3 family transposase [Alicyclobacillaceae bacterium MYW30-H2]